MTNLLHNDTITRTLSQAIARGDAALENIPGLLQRVITENMWQDRVIPESGQEVHFDRFEKFVTTPPLEGLGTTMEVIRALCNKDKDVLILLDDVTKKTQRQHGGDRKSSDYKSSNDSYLKISKGPDTRERIVARLQSDGHRELAQRVVDREITGAEAKRIAGYKPKRPAIAADNPHSAAHTILANMSKEDIIELLAILAEAIAQRE